MKTRYLNSQISTAITVFAAILLLLLYFMGLHYHSYYPTALFFIAMGIIIVMITYQCLAVPLTRSFIVVVLIEITFANLVFHLMYQLPGYGMWGSDGYSDLASMESILVSGFVRGAPEYVQLTSFFPMLHVLGSQISLVTGFDAFTVAKWFPSLIDLALIPVLYLLVRFAFKEAKVALLASFVFVCLAHHALYSSAFIRETIALVMALCCIYLYLVARSSEHPLVYRSLAILCLFGTVVAHHLTAIMLLLFLVIHFVVTNAADRQRLRKSYFGEQITVEKIGWSVVLLLAVAIFTYWLLVVILPMRLLVDLLESVITPSEWGSRTYLQLTGMTSLALPSLRYYVMIYGSYACYLIFGLILLQRWWPKVRNLYIETYTFSLYLFICGLAGILSFYLLPATIIGDRFLSFGWLFGFGPLIAVILASKRKWLITVSITTLIVFMFINLYTIHPTEWNSEAKGASARASQEDFKMAQTFNFDSNSVLAPVNNLMAIYETSNVLGVNVFELTEEVTLGDFQWVVINRQSFEEEGLYSDLTWNTLAAMQQLDNEGSTLFNKIFESNNVALFTYR